MKKRLWSAGVLLTFLILSTQAEPRGWGVGIGTFEGDFGMQARKDFLPGAQDQYGIELQGGLYNQNKWTTRLDADFHYLFRPGAAFRLYPLAGVDWAIQRKNNRAGFNLGGGLTLELNPATRLFIELKHVFGEWDGYAFTFGIYF